MRLLFSLLFATSLFCSNVNGQGFEAGVFAGIANYKGELSPGSFGGNLKQMHAAYGGFARYNVNSFVAVRFNVFGGKLSAEDAKAITEDQKERNLSFRSNVLEFGLTGEFNILGYQPYNLERPFSPYVFAGINMFKFKPQAYYDNAWVDLRPLGTEGQGLEQFPGRKLYKQLDFSIPFGVGVKYALTDQWNVGLEFGARATFTDYLDDVSTTYVDYDALLAANGMQSAELSNRSTADVAVVAGSQRGDDSNNDWYFMSGIFISYNFSDNGLVGGRNRSKRKRGCDF